MNTLLLQPTDVLFFRDGRPMGGASAGHGEAWPLPNVTDAALHAALRRSGLECHKHDQIRRDGKRGRENICPFGSLVTAGPFPVKQDNGVSTWFFPRPLDLQTDTLKPSLRPCSGDWNASSSLLAPLSCAIAHVDEARLSKDSAAKAWLSQAAFGRYLQGGHEELDDKEALDDRDFSNSEVNIGIAIDPDTQTTGQGEAEGKIYSAHYLRLREGWHLGLFAATSEKKGDSRTDLIPTLLDDGQHIIVGGQQRACTAALLTRTSFLSLPQGKRTFPIAADGKVRVKWVLLSPAVFPAITTDGATHTGGWLPSWVCQSDGAVQLRTESSPRGQRETREEWRARVQHKPMISARLVAALIPKPVVVTGWALGDEDLGDEGRSGAKSTHLAVPAGAVYYFEAESADDARSLASALNWHGSSDGSEIKNRRSTLLGEKGFGLGVCGTWQFHGEH